MLAANETATNVLRHGSGVGRLTVWADSGGLVCDVSGPGRIDDPLVGRRLLDDSTESGRVVWLVNQVCDLVELRSGPAGTIVRMHIAA